MSLISEQAQGFLPKFPQKARKQKKSSGFLFLPTSASLTTFIGMCKIFFLPMSEPFYLSTQFRSVFCAMYINLLDLFFCSLFYGIKKKLLLFHKAVSVHGPSYWSSLLSAKEEDEYRSSRKSEILGWSKRGTGDLEHSWINSGIQELNSGRMVREKQRLSWIIYFLII